jgi:hypothetical protein
MEIMSKRPEEKISTAAGESSYESGSDASRQKQSISCLQSSKMSVSDRTAATTIMMSTASMTIEPLDEEDDSMELQMTQKEHRYSVPLPPHPHSNAQTILRHDEQADEAHYDLREDANDDVEKGKLKFPPPEKLFGRQDDVKKLQALYNTTCESVQHDKVAMRMALLEGPSGVGKSCLVRHGLLQSSDVPLVATGKFNQHASHPFSAILQSLEELVSTVLQTEDPCAAKYAPPRGRTLWIQRLKKANFFASVEARLLSTFCPSLKPMFASLGKRQENADIDGNKTVSTSNTSMSSLSSSALDIDQCDMSQLASSLARFFHLLATPQQPLVWFLDDLQWADASSLELLRYVLLMGTEHSLSTEFFPLHRVLFVGAYQPIGSIQVADTSAAAKEGVHPLQALLDKLRENEGKDESASMACRMLELQVSNLRPKDILAFVRATLDDMPEEEAWPLTNALYSATLGNIFHCQQALEYLVRTNCLYYDVMFFSWQCNLPKNDNGEENNPPLLKDAVSQDVLQLVQSKMMACPKLLQALLIRAALAANTFFSGPLLRDLLQATGYPELTQRNFRVLLNQAIDEGFLLDSTWTLKDEQEVNNSELQYYQFSHDKVKEAALELASLLPQHEMEQLCLTIGTVLVEWAVQLTSPAFSGPTIVASNKEWMWFVAMNHFNSLPLGATLDHNNSTDNTMSSSCLSRKLSRTQLVEWNYRVADLALRKGSFQQSIEFLHAALRYLPEDEMWISRQYYTLSLRVYNKLMEIEFAQGNHSATKDAIAIILAKTRSPQDQITAHYIRIQV